MESFFLDWRLYALGSAVFAALTAIFGKIGVSEMNSNLATFIRTLVILVVTASLVSLRNEWTRPSALNGRSIAFLMLSGVATGFSWLCYYRALQLGPVSRVAPVDKLSVVLVMALAFLFLGETFSVKAMIGGLFIAVGVGLMAF